MTLLPDNDRQHELRGLLASLDDGFCLIEVIFDPPRAHALDYRFVEVNAAFCRHTGIENAEGKTARALVPDLDEFWYASYGRVALTGEATRFERYEPAMQKTFEVQAVRVGEPEHRRVAVLFRDITERRAVEARLQASEATLRSLYDSTTFMMGIVELPDDDSGIFHVFDSQASCRFFGIEPDSLVGKSTHALGVPPNLTQQWINHYRQSQHEAKEVRFEYLHPTAAGARWLASVVACIGRASNGRTRFWYVTEDITQAKQDEQRLRDRDTHLRLAMAASLTIAFEWDISNNRVRRLQSLEEALPQTEGKSDTLEGVEQIVHPDDRELFRNNVQAALNSADGTYLSDHRIVRPNGEVRWLLESGRVEFDSEQRPARLLGISQDITDRHHAEEEIRRQALLINVSHDPIMAWTLERGILEWNAGAERLYGYSRAEALGQDIHVLLKGVQPVAEAAAVHAVEQSGQWRGELRHRCKDGGEVTVESHQQAISFRGERLILESNRDISERKQAEQALKFSEARFKRLFETNLLGIIFWDLEGGVHDANDEFLRIIGYDRSDLAAGRVNWTTVTPSEHMAQDERAVEELRRNGKCAPMVKEYFRKDGSRVWVMLGLAMLDAEHGVGFVLDISRQKQVEAALRKSDERARQQAARAERERAVLDAILEAAPAGIIVADANGKLLRFNPANELLWGPAPLSEGVDEYVEWKGWWADHSERHGRRLAPQDWAMSRALQGEIVRNHIVQIEPFDRPGFRRTMMNSGAPVRDANGHIQGAVVAQMDISALSAAEAARVESEAKFRAIAEAQPGLLFVHSSEGLNSFVNQAFCVFAGRDPEGLLGDRWTDLVCPLDSKRAWPLFLQAVAEGRRCEAEFRFRRHDGQWRWHMVRSVPQKAADGTITHWVATANDITERKATEEALKEADRRKDEFIAILAHELRNPLAPVRNAAEILRRVAPAEPRVQRAREVIDRQLTHMSRLIDDLLDVSRIARGKLPLQRERCDLAAIVRQTAEDYRTSLEAEGLSLVLPTAAPPLWVQGDPVRLAQMVGNLLNNAGRFTQAGGRVEVHTELDAAQRVALVKISDTGEGIEPELLSRLFDPFSQADQGLARTKGGLGLGLALTKGLAELHGGEVEAQSPGKGRGATFVLRIPLSPQANQAAQAQEAEDKDGAGLRVLVVEDNVDSAETLAELLSIAGYAVKLAFDGVTGLLAAKGFRPQAVISDLGLPGEMDGYDVAKALRADPSFKGIRLIALSGYASAEARQLSSEAGFDVHFAKPPDLGKLEKELAAIRRPGPVAS